MILLELFGGPLDGLQYPMDDTLPAASSVDIRYVQATGSPTEPAAMRSARYLVVMDHIRMEYRMEHVTLKPA